MTNPLKWWFNRKPFTPSILKQSEPLIVDALLESATQASIQRAEKAAQHSRNISASVVSLHNEFLKLIEGSRT